MGNIIIKKIKIDRDYEFVEKKGWGHPDTLADKLAEELSIEYSKYTLKKFKVILHHNFDKIGILGGSSFVKFGEGHLIDPLRILINGRVSTKFNKKNIPYKEIIEKTTKKFIKKIFPLINVNKDLLIIDNISTKSSPGKTNLKSKKEGTRNYWFEPRGKHDLKELKFLGSNDTSLGVGFAPLTKFENSIKILMDSFKVKSLKKDYLWLGSDIKIMALKINKNINLTLCIPQISKFVQNKQQYKKNLKIMHQYIYNFIAKKFPYFKINLFLNTRDDFETGEIYLTAIGSSIESGDEGLVGRGNRINQLICQTKPYTMEGAAGKNPVYHIGKIYNLAAQEIANKISKKIKTYSEVFLISQSGRLLIDPWKTIVGIEKELNKKEIDNLKKFIKKELNNIPQITNKLIKKQFKIA
ncbi:MAG: methionine adenosyltransferase [Nanoarchaeota archaeon]|nr:methionine adenosyltransferase [Nanoarchaeota archaeon]MBU4351722.1 methionine adenosyltransferase [Nanoarchaeota archaeon]